MDLIVVFSGFIRCVIWKRKSDQLLAIADNTVTNNFKQITIHQNSDLPSIDWIDIIPLITFSRTSSLSLKISIKLESDCEYPSPILGSALYASFSIYRDNKAQSGYLSNSLNALICAFRVSSSCSSSIPIRSWHTSPQYIQHAVSSAKDWKLPSGLWRLYFFSSNWNAESANPFTKGHLFHYLVIHNNEGEMMLIMLTERKT